MRVFKKKKNTIKVEIQKSTFERFLKVTIETFDFQLRLIALLKVKNLK